MKKLIIYGASYPDILNLIKSINEKEKLWEVIGFLDDNKDIREIKGIPVLGDKSYLNSKNLQDVYFFNNIYKNTKTRKKISDLISNVSTNIANLIHPSVELNNTSLGNGIIINSYTYIGDYVSIHDHVAIRANCHIGHNSIINKYSFIAPAACVNGHCKIGEGVYFGSNSVINERLNVGDWATVGSGSSVVKSIKSYSKVAGSPAKNIE
tara:strand:- start:346 stop:972 length:627 start_codon:yes stop_codon:yes gene_type:complete